MEAAIFPKQARNLISGWKRMQEKRRIIQIERRVCRYAYVRSQIRSSAYLTRAILLRVLQKLALHESTLQLDKFM